MMSALISDVLNYQLDAAFVSGPLNVRGLEQIHIKEEQLVIVAAAEGPTLEELLTKQPLKIVVFG